MNAAYISALAALCGSAIGALASFATTWLTQSVQDRQQREAQSTGRRERLYGEFIDEASLLFADALTHELQDTARLVRLYAIMSKIRLFAPDAVVATSNEVMQRIVDTYNVPNLDLAAIGKLDNSKVDLLRSFTERCRDDLRG